MSRAKSAFFSLGWILWVLITGCDGERKRDDLEKWMSDSMSTYMSETSFSVPPTLDKSRASASGNGANPFDLSNLAHESQFSTDSEQMERQIHPHKNRKKELLENYELHELDLVGVLERNEKKWAVISTSDGLIVNVVPGRYLGPNFGRVTRIENNAMALNELVEDDQGRWYERRVEIPLRKMDSTNLPDKLTK